MLFFGVCLSGVRGLLRLSVPCAIILLLMGSSLEKENGRLLRSFKRTGEKVFNYLKGHWKWMAFAAGCVLFLYAVYFAFSFRTQPIYQSVDQAYWGIRNILFRVFCGGFDLGIFVWGVWLYARGRLSARNACVLLAFMAMITSMCYSFSTPIWDYGRHWNQHDDYYASTGGQYLMSDGVLDGGSGHFGLIMTFFRTGRVPEIKLKNGVYDFSFSAVGERYQPKTFYMVTGWFMRWNSWFIRGAEGNVNINGYDMSNTEWALFEANRILWTALVWFSYYYIYKAMKSLGLKGKGLVLGFAVIAFCPMFYFFANWDNNDGMSAFFAFAALYRGISYFRNKDWKSCLLCALDIGLSMSCKLGGAIVALAIIPMLVYGFVENVLSSKGQPFSIRLPWVRMLFQGLCFALIVFPVGLFWPVYSKIRFGQDLFFFSDAANPRLSITMPLWQACFLWPNKESFWSIFVYHFQYPEWNQIQDVSLTSNVFKKALFNEYQWGHSYMQLSFLYVAAFLLVLYVLVMIPVRIVCMMATKQGPRDWKRFTIIASALIANWGWLVWFIYKSPYTCNCDIRYIPTFVLGFGALLGTDAESPSFRNEKLQKIYAASQIVLVAAFVFGSVLAYLTVTAWYAPLKV